MATLRKRRAQPVLERTEPSPLAPIILGIETSCDDTGVGIVRGGIPIFNKRLTSASQHELHGGIVPEIASRSHLEYLSRILRCDLDEAGIRLKDISAIGVTVGPGLMGPLLVGISSGKGLALGLDIPLIPINHLEAHLHSVFIGEEVVYPYLALIVSGGHTELVFVHGLGNYENLGRTLDDSAGEAIDKIGRVVGLGFPAGPRMDQIARSGNPEAISFPRVKIRGTGFSYSGLKTAALLWLRNNPDYSLPDFCASYLRAVFEQLLEKLEFAIANFGPSVVSVVGGVAANSYFRERLKTLADRWGVTLKVPPPEWCTDNGLMVAYTAYLYYRAMPRLNEKDLDVDPSLDLGMPTPGLSG